MAWAGGILWFCTAGIVVGLLLVAEGELEEDEVVEEEEETKISQQCNDHVFFAAPDKSGAKAADANFVCAISSIGWEKSRPWM